MNGEFLCMPHEEVLEWMEKADEDLEAARRLLSGEPLTAPAAFHCQQASEKALKAFLVSRGGSDLPAFIT